MSEIINNENNGLGNLGGNLSGNLGNIGNLNPLTPDLSGLDTQEENPEVQDVEISEEEGTSQEPEISEEQENPEEENPEVVEETPSYEETLPEYDGTPEYTGLTQTVEETITFTMDERKDNAMTLAEKVSELDELKQEYQDLIVESNNAIRDKQIEIDALEKEIAEIKEGVVNESVTKDVTYDVYETLDKKIFVPINKQPIEANFAKIIDKTEAEIANFRLTHRIPTNLEPVAEIQPVNPGQVSI